MHGEFLGIRLQLYHNIKETKVHQCCYFVFAFIMLLMFLMKMLFHITQGKFSMHNLPNSYQELAGDISQVQMQGVIPEKAMITTHHIMQHGIYTMLHLFLS